ncbi:MAG: hypothetical protein IAF94_14525 [Pirellulaceae bacterium]|nr:hypothetical protein [Pirellulaceae bacterium]
MKTVEQADFGLTTGEEEYKPPFASSSARGITFPVVKAGRMAHIEEREHKGRGAACAIAGAVLTLLPLLYVLGLGPAGWLVRRYPDSAGVLRVVYYPLFVLSENSLTAQRTLRWYVELWN